MSLQGILAAVAGQQSAGGGSITSPFETDGSPLWSSWGDDPSWTNPGDAGEITSWRNDGSEGNWTNGSTTTSNVTFDSDGINGHGAIDFTGSNAANPQINIALGSAVSQPYTMLTVVKFAADTTGAVFAGNNHSVRLSSGNLSLYDGASPIETLTSFHSTDLVALIYAVVNGSSSTLYGNGATSSASGSMGTNTMSSIAMGTQGTSNELAMKVGYSGGWSGDVSGQSWFTDLVSFLNTYYGIS